MAIAVRTRPVAGVGLWSAYRHEIFKGSKQFFYQIVVITPLMLFIIATIVPILVRVFANPQKGVRVGGNPYATLDLGSGGTFLMANQLLQTIGVYGILVVAACCLSVANEYRWNTIKMLTTRQPSRVYIVLSKVLFALTLVAGVFISALIGWFIYGMGLKIAQGVDFTIDATDLDAIGKGLKAFSMSMLQTFIFALAGIALTFRYKSILGGIVCYVIYNAVDGAFSNLGAVVANTGYGGFPEWMHPILDFVKFLNPYLLTSSVQRITQREYVARFDSPPDQLFPNQLIVLSTPVWWAWLMIGIYLVFFTAMSILAFARRDITD